MTYPTNADVVIVQHYWWDDNTRRGVDQSVVFTPVSGASPLPNLVDSSAHGWVKTRQWTTKPDPATGYFAVPLTASNDPDLTDFTGYQVQPSGESSFTIAVDVAASTVPVTPEMSAALAALTPPVTVGSTVKAVWLTDVALVGPSPTPPASFFTATQTTDLVLDAIAAHDDDSNAHPDIRALLGSGGGGPTDKLVGSRIASTIMSGHRIVTPTSTGSVEYADCTIAAHRTRPMWMTLAAANSGDPVSVLYTGPTTEPSWSWSPGPVYLGVNGALTQVAPSPPSFLVCVGYATSGTTFYLDPQPAIVLA